MINLVLHNATIFTGVTQILQGAVVIEDGRISDVFSKKRFEQRLFKSGTELWDLEEAYLTPGLIDTHIHGLQGFGTNDLSAESIIAMSEAMTEYGVTAFCPPLYHRKDQDFIQSIRKTTAAIGREDGAAILGIHLEGPFQR